MTDFTVADLEALELAKKRLKSKRWESALILALRAHGGLPGPLLEYRFAPPRRWRFDFAWPREMLAVEVDGGASRIRKCKRCAEPMYIFGGRHHSKDGMAKDCEKGFAALSLGWRVLHVTPDQIQSGEAVKWIVTLLKGKE